MESAAHERESRCLERGDPYSGLRGSEEYRQKGPELSEQEWVWKHAKVKCMCGNAVCHSKLMGLDRNVCLGVGYNWSFGASLSWLLSRNFGTCWPASLGRIAPGMIDMVKSMPWGDKRKAAVVKFAV